MKKLIALSLALLLLLCGTLSLASCSEQKTSQLIDFDAKYLTPRTDDNDYYTFFSDGTGYYYYRKETTSSTISLRVHFEWREASDGAIYLFKTSTEHLDDHTAELTSAAVINYPIFFSEDFFTYTPHSQYGGSTQRYVKEGSELDTILKQAAQNEE